MQAPVTQTSPHVWFLRRPLFWLGLAAVLGIHACWNWAAPTWLCVVITLGAALLTAALRSPVGVALIVAGVFASLVAAERGPPVAPRAATVEGVVVRSFGERRSLVDVERRLTPTGWARHRERIGAVLPTPAQPGDRLELSGTLVQPPVALNPGGFDERMDWLRRGAQRVLHARPQGVRRLATGVLPGWRRWALSVRGGIVRRNEATLRPEAALIANAFLLGETSAPVRGVREDVEAAFRDSGTIHLLVVSGTQISLVLAAFVWLGWRLWRWRLLCWGAGVVAVGAFWLLTDGDASVTRAAVMAGVVMLGLALGRETDAENGLGLAALVLLVHNRFAAFDIGAQLSFAAVWGLVRLTPVLTAAVLPRERPDEPSPWRPLVLVASASVAAHLAVGPVLGYQLQRAGWAGMAANIPMFGVASALMLFSLAHALLAPVGLGVAPWVNTAAEGLLGWARLFAMPGLGAGSVLPFSPWLAVPYYGCLALPATLGRYPRAKLAAVAAAVVVLLLSQVVPALPPSTALVQALDVGQGDAILLRDRAGARVLVDAGPPSAGPELIRALRSLRIVGLDAVVVSHADSDHIGGLPRVLAEVPVGTLLHRVDPEPEEVALWSDVLAIAARRAVPVLVPASGDRVRLAGSHLTFLGPVGPGRGNEGSLVARWDADGWRCLLTGDAGFAAEADLLRWGSELRADVLKLGHHGSAGSTGGPFLRAVLPAVGLISCGRDNRYGHPSLEALNRLSAMRVPVYRTDVGGMLTVARSGNGIRVHPHIPPNARMP